MALGFGVFEGEPFLCGGLNLQSPNTPSTLPADFFGGGGLKVFELRSWVLLV